MSDILPWTRRDSRTILKTPWIELLEETFVTPQGLAVGPFHTLAYHDWVTILAVTPEDRLVLIRQFRHGAQAIMLELPGGSMDAGEAPEETAVRELLEETGYRGEAVRLLATTWANPVSHRNRHHVVLITGARRVAEPKDDPTEQIAAHEASLAEVMDKAASGEIGHPLHLSALFLFQLKGKEGA